MEKNFQINLEGTTLIVKIGFELTKKNAPVLQQLLNSYKGQDIQKIVFDTNDLVFISSAGIRCVLFARQELGQNPEITFLNCAKEIIDTFKISGLHRFIKFVEDEHKHMEGYNAEFRNRMAEIRQQELDNFAANNDVVCYQMKIDEED